MENKFAWSFLGFLMAIIFGAITLYLGFYKEIKPDLNFVITADSSVLDVKENLGNLDVIYENESLSERRQDLRFITFRVVNQGNGPILSNYYDKNDPVGFEVIDGKLADDPKLLNASNEYLKEKLLTKKIPENKVVFSNVILEPSEYFELKVLVLHEIGKKPYIKAFGKVATVYSIDVLRDFASVNKLSFLEITFGGGLFANMTRLFAYGLSFLFLLIGLILFFDKLEEIKEKRRKRRVIKTFKEYDSDKVTGKDGFFFDYYLNHGADVVRDYHSIMKSESILSSLLNQSEASEEKTINTLNQLGKNDKAMFEELKNEGFVTVKNGAVIVDEQRLSVLTDFVNYLKRKGELKKSRYFYTKELSDLKKMESYIEGFEESE
ncbi:MAG: hypothetical protein P1U70_27015 [Saprospiraceae bacterium]|nr:hypothetical protein [Saprospiraceae bacterium]